MTVGTSGTLDYAGYRTFEIPDGFALPGGNGAIILSISGAKPVIGTDENLLRNQRPLFNAKIDKGSSFLLVDGAFTQAQRDKVSGALSYTDEIDLCIRAYTE